MRKRLTFANLISFTALFLALAGGSYAAVTLTANSVGSRQLRAGAVTSSKLAAQAVTGNKIASGAVTATDVAPGSLTGADINVGTLGKVPSAAVADSASIARVVTVSASGSAAPNSIVGATATCPSGMTVVGGGANLSDEYDLLVNDTYPSASNSWTVHVGAGASGGTAFTVYAICVPAVSTS